MRSFFKVSLSIATLLLVCHAMLHAQTIVPTQTDEIIIDNGTSGKADPGDRIRYKVTIQNTGGPSGTNTQLNVVPDPRTTFAAGTFKSSPLALPDAYTCTGNVPIFVAAPGVKGNDFDEGAPASLSITTATNQATLRGGSVDIFADGSFEYTPPAGYEGDDSFTYTLNDATQAGPGAPVTDVGTVTITISGMIWFINNAAAAGDGRLSSPFNSLGAFNTANGGMTMNNGDAVNPEVNETIFLYTGGGNYTGGITLLTGQRLFGQGASTANLGTLTGITFNPNSLTLPMAGGTRPVITNAAGDGILLGSGNTVRGLNIGVCSDFGIDDNGTVGTLTISEVDINTTGGGFRTDNGGTLAVTLGAVTAGGIRGIHLAGTAGSFSVSGATTTSGTVNQGIWIDNTSTNVSFAAITISSTGSGSNAFELSGNSGTFNASGTTTINAPAAGGSVSLLVSGGTGGITFANIDINGRRDIGFHISGGSRNITTGTLDIDNSNSVASANAFQTSNVTGGTMSFGATTINANATNSHCMSINNTAAAITFAAGSAVNNSNVSEIDIVGGNGNVTYNGTVNSTAGQAVAVGVHTGGTVEFTGNITANGGNTGILLSQNSGGTIIFSGASKSLTSLTTVGVSMFNCIGTTVNFTNGGLVINNTTATGFQATSGGTLTVQGTGNTISSGTATALIVINTNIGAGNLNFQSISNNGGVNGIVLNNTGASGGLVVTGTGAANSGGTIQNTSSHGILLTSTTSPSFNNLRISSTTRSGIKGTMVNNFSFTNGTIEYSGVTSGGTIVGSQDDSHIAFNDGSFGTPTTLEQSLTGVVTITGNTFNTAYYQAIDLFNYQGTISHANISDNTFTSGGTATISLGSAIRIIASGGAANNANLTRATVNNNTITGFPSGAGIFISNNNASPGAPACTMGIPGSATDIIAITNNRISGFSLATRIGTNAIVFAINGPTPALRSRANINISNNGTLANPISNVGGTAIGMSVFGNTDAVAVVNNNVVSPNNSVGSQGIGGGIGRTIATSDTPNLELTVNNNTISNTDGNGILMVAREASGTFDLTIKNNNVAKPLGGIRPGIRVDAGGATGLDDAICLDISGNISEGSGDPASSKAPGIGLRKQGTVATVNDFGVEGMAATSTPGVENYINGLNPGSVAGGPTGGGVGGTLLISATSGFTNCSTAPLAPSPSNQ